MWKPVDKKLIDLLVINFLNFASIFSNCKKLNGLDLNEFLNLNKLTKDLIINLFPLYNFFNKPICNGKRKNLERLLYFSNFFINDFLLSYDSYAHFFVRSHVE